MFLKFLLALLAQLHIFLLGHKTTHEIVNDTASMIGNGKKIVSRLVLLAIRSTLNRPITPDSPKKSKILVFSKFLNSYKKA